MAKNGVFILSIYLGVNCILNVSVLSLTQELLAGDSVCFAV